MPSSRVVPVEAIPGTRYARLLTYPTFEVVKVRERVRELLSIGVTALQLQGSSLIDGIPVLGKGWVGIVTSASLDSETVALKIRRDDADRPTMLSEARMLRLANSVGVGPRLITATKNLLAMEFLDGIPLFKWANGRPNKTAAKRLISDLLESCFKLDSIGLDHGELSHAPRNVLVGRSGRGFVVDFESSSTTRRNANVTSLVQYFLFGGISKPIQARKIFPNRRKILRTLSVYKQQPSVENFRHILDVLKVP